MKKHIANIITISRILCSILMLFFPVFSARFYILYIFCGFSDMIDGIVARKTNNISQFGSQFDTIADSVFVAVSMIKFFPLIHIPIWLWMWIGVITIIKTSAAVLNFFYNKKLISLHTIMNKATGFLLFLLPLALHFTGFIYSCIVVCSIATFSAIQEVRKIKSNCN